MDHLNNLRNLSLKEITFLNGDIRQITKNVNLNYLDLAQVKNCSGSTSINLPNYAFDKENAVSSNNTDQILYERVDLSSSCYTGFSEKTFCSRNTQKKVFIKDLVLQLEIDLDAVFF